MSVAAVRRKYVIAGQVQGVGFRPFVFRIAHDNSITGTVANTSRGVFIEAQGSPAAVEAFGIDLTDKLPPLARVVSRTEEDIPSVDGETKFIIISSEGGDGQNVLISADVSTCADCLNDMFNSTDRRYLYPFTNCTNCGPRYTITRSIPYDRDKTSMACFPLCEHCRAEYENPMDRRFHAQPNACPICGPHVWLTAPDGTELARDTEAIGQTARALAKGNIAAIKGLGGFHLACDATNHDAVARLRSRKKRPGKPLAVMVANIETARQLADITNAEAALLQSIERPIVLCKLRPEADQGTALSPLVSPDTAYVGLMLPYTPLHHVLFHLYQDIIPQDGITALVMTSGNLSSEPISLGNREALMRLHTIADVFLLHNRDILIRTDDSVTRVNPDSGEPQFLRRARGYTPRPIFLAEEGPCVMATGPELKSTLCFTRGDQAFVSQHIGDLQNLETYGFYREIARHLQSVLEVEPEAIIRDLHPDYLSTTYADGRSKRDAVPVLSLQHHFAHIYSVLAENRHQGAALGLALDGTGYGEDGTIWGGELLYADTEDLEQERLGHLAPLMLPGGEAAIREPWRIAQGLLWMSGVFEPLEKTWPWQEQFKDASRVLPQVLERNLNSPLTSSCGRLFDAVSAMLGLCLNVTYEGQAAIMLEYVQDMSITEPYPCPMLTDAQPLVLDTHTLFLAAYADWQNGVPAGVISRKFHLGLMYGLTEMTYGVAAVMGVNTVGLSGGVMQNRTFCKELPELLRQYGLEVLVHRELPPNDACISLGQAYWGRKMLRQG
ncbi:carbamoyltransferase HypF [Oleidesulfovibrio sp.]|uniref:carbamoyltransferase HypF n=1 Tax=Oleidesulfovibrio sp. TaxID=2909707 RepID=UPI003A8C6157